MHYLEFNVFVTVLYIGIIGILNRVWQKYFRQDSISGGYMWEVFLLQPVYSCYYITDPIFIFSTCDQFANALNPTFLHESYR